MATETKTFIFGNSTTDVDTTVNGDLTVTGQVKGNADSADKLKTARKISNKSFDGTADIALDSTDINPLQSKTYTGIYAEQDNDTYGYKYYGRINPTSYKALWHLKIRITGYVPGYDDYYGSYIFDFTGMRNTYSAYACWNNIQNSSYRPFYYHSIRFGSNETNTISYGHIIGMYLRSCANNTNSAYARTYKIELLECDNCTFTFFDNFMIYNNITGTGNFNSVNNFDAANNGLRETGDDNTIDQIRRTHSSLTIGSELNINQYSLFGFDRDNKAIAISNYQSGYTSYTVSINASRVYSTLGIDYTKGLYMMNGLSYCLAGATIYSSFHINNPYTALDFRYSDNCVSGSGTDLNIVSYKPIFFRGVIKSDGLFYLSPYSVTYNNISYQKVWTQDIPTSVENDSDGNQYVYWFIGYPYYNSTYQVNLFSNNNIYWYHNGRFEEYIGHAESADIASKATNDSDGNTITSYYEPKSNVTSKGSATQPVYFDSNGVAQNTTYTLGKSVPSDAKFTDTNTWRGIQDNLTSTSTEDSLSANQGKVLKDLVDGKQDNIPVINLTEGWNEETETIIFTLRENIDISEYSYGDRCLFKCYYSTDDANESSYNLIVQFIGTNDSNLPVFGAIYTNFVGAYMLNSYHLTFNGLTIGSTVSYMATYSYLLSDVLVNGESALDLTRSNDGYVTANITSHTLTIGSYTFNGSADVSVPVYGGEAEQDAPN